MNGRTCQLCGKPLSRFTVGSGGDFCSREHRNQFRLRLGMDRLQEANKVASLMRRRENAKAIPAAQLMRDFGVQPRTAPPLRVPVRPPTIRSMSRRNTLLEPPRISSTAPSLLATQPRPTPIRATSRKRESADSFTSRQIRPLLPPRADRFPVQLLPAGAVNPRPGASAVKERRRQPSELRLKLIRTHFGSNGIQIRSPRSTIQTCQEPQRARPLINSADRGRDLRVSGGLGFRLPQKRLRSIPFAVPRAKPLRQASELRALTAASLPAGASPRDSVIPISVRGPSGPKPPAQNNVVEFRWPSAITTDTTLPRHAAETNRMCDVEWEAPAPCPPELRLNGMVRCRPSATVVPFVSTPVPRPIESVHRLTLVAFEPQDASFEWSPTALHGTLVSGLQFGATPIHKTDTPSVTLEEHFDAGLRNWLGGTDDWRVDVAGVRAGSLALYSPSLEAPDYLLEFLTRIETNGVTWVFRAANFNDYYQATLAVAPAGGYEFRRHAVIGGAAEADIVRPVPPASPTPAHRTAVTLRTQVAGNQFTVSLDGQVIDTWNDSRLTTGGIGFLGAPEDRARLYWVKVTPTGHLSKEHSKQ